MYVDAEERQLRETLEQLVREETWQPMEDAQQTNVLKSSSELFGVIKKSLTRCSKFVSRGAAMLELCKAFQVGPLLAGGWASNGLCMTVQHPALLASAKVGVSCSGLPFRGALIETGM